jgi:hypothetical protein
MHHLHGYHGAVPPMALIALFAPMARSTNRSTPHHGNHRMPATERYRRPADQRVPVPDGIRSAEKSQTLLTAEPLDLDHEHEIIRRVHQERNQAPAVRAKCSERSGIETSSRSSRRRWYCTGSTITTASMNALGILARPEAGRRTPAEPGRPAPTGTPVRRRTGSGSPPGSSADPQAADPRPGSCGCEPGIPAALGGHARRPPRTTSA